MLRAARTTELCDALAPLITSHKAILIENDGVVTYAGDLLAAYMHMETVVLLRLHLPGDTPIGTAACARPSASLRNCAALKKQRAMSPEDLLRK